MLQYFTVAILLVGFCSNAFADEDCASLRDRFTKYSVFAESNGVQAIFKQFMTKSMRTDLGHFMAKHQITDDSGLAGIDLSLRFPVHEKNVVVSNLECGPNSGSVLISSNTRGFTKNILFRFELESDEWKIASVEHSELEELETPR